jgi:hypothetical protein
MSAGEISGNTASFGGGVSAGTFTMSAGEISGNTASTGGGVSAETFTISGGKISGNTASSSSSATGGGVSAGTFAMSGGEISGNTASSSSSSYGCGVDISGSSGIISGGEISGNTASSSSSSYGGGVHVGDTGLYLSGSNKTFTKQGGIIYGSDAGTLRNIAKTGDAVYVFSDGRSARKRNRTAATGVTLDSSVDGASGGWEASTVANITYSPRNAAMRWSSGYDGWHQSPSLSSISNYSTKERINFTSAEANASITIQLVLSSTEGKCYAFISSLDNGSATSAGGYYTLISVEEDMVSARRTISVSTAGSHFVDVCYGENSPLNSEGYVRFKVLE